MEHIYIRILYTAGTGMKLGPFWIRLSFPIVVVLKDMMYIYSRTEM